MLNLKTTSEIKEELFKNSNFQQNFPKKVNFPFPKSYTDIVTKIKTTEISAECILYSSISSTNETNCLSDLDYWEDDFDIEKIKNYWFIGANGQGDLWILDRNDSVLFFDHNTGEISDRNLIDLGLNFEKWLQFAFLNKDFEKSIDKIEFTDEIKVIYREKLKDVSLNLDKNYPFEI